LNEVEKSFITNADDYRPPCQIEVFWLSEPLEYQIIVISHDPDRPDKEIIINGPFKGHEFVNEIEKIMNEPRWKKPIPKDSPYLGAKTGKIKRSDVFATRLSGFLNLVRNSVFFKIEKGHLGGMILDSNCWCWYVKGRVDELDYFDFVNKIINDIKQRVEIAKSKPENVQMEAQPKPKLKGYGTHFYPPIWIGEIPERTFRQKVSGQLYPPPSKILDFNFNGRTLVINSDGFIGVEAENKGGALRILNTIFGIAFMSGIDCLSARELELAEIEIVPDSLTISATTWQISSLRSLLMEWLRPDSLFYLRKEVSKEVIEKILNKAKIVAKNEKLAELVTFLIEGYTHYSNSEYSQSFIINWLIVERYLSELWGEFIKERQVNGDRKSKLKNPIQWGIDHILETLNLTGKLNDETYKLLIDLKNKRNRFVHRGETIDKPTSEKLLNFSFKIVESRLSQLFDGDWNEESGEI
jgi:hypothetical protein